jgi:hypothetical protein
LAVRDSGDPHHHLAGWRKIPLQDGHTRKVERPTPEQLAPFLASHRVTLTILRGPAAGTEIEFDRPRLIIGRGDAADVHIDAVSVSSEHAPSTPTRGDSGFATSPARMAFA